MSRSVIVSAVRTPFGKLGGALAGYEATELGAIAIRGALDRAGVEDEEVEYAVMGQVLQGGVGPGARAPGDGRRGAAGRAALGHDQQGLRVVDPRGRDRRPDDPRGRRPGRGRGRDGVDVERAVRAQEGALRLPARRRHADRPDDPRRADLELRLASTWSSRRRSSRGSSASRARTRTHGRCARTSAR